MTTEMLDNLDNNAEALILGSHAISLIPVMDKKGRDKGGNEPNTVRPRSLIELSRQANMGFGTRVHQLFGAIGKIFHIGENDKVSESHWRKKRHQIAADFWGKDPKSFDIACREAKKDFRDRDIGKLLSAQKNAAELMDLTSDFSPTKINIIPSVSEATLPGVNQAIVNLMEERWRDFREAMAETVIALSFHEAVADTETVWFSEAIYAPVKPESIVKLKALLDDSGKKEELATALSLDLDELVGKLSDWLIQGKDIFADYQLPENISLKTLIELDVKKLKQKIDGLGQGEQNKIWAIRRIVLAGLELQWLVGGRIFTDFRKELDQTKFKDIFKEFAAAQIKNNLQEFLILASSEGKELKSFLKQKISGLIQDFPPKMQMTTEDIESMAEILSDKLIFSRDEWFATVYGFRLDWFGIKKGEKGNQQKQEKILAALRDYRQKLISGEKTSPFADQEFQGLLDKAALAGCQMEIIEVKAKTGTVPDRPYESDKRELAVNLNQLMQISQARAERTGKLEEKETKAVWLRSFSRARLLYLGVRNDKGFARPDIREFTVFDDLRDKETRNYLAEVRQKYLDAAYLRFSATNSRN